MATAFICFFIGGIVSEFVQSALPVRVPHANRDYPKLNYPFVAG